MAKNWFFGLTTRLVMLIVAALLVLSYASVFVNPARIWLVSLAGILFVPFSLVNLLLFFWAIKRRSKSFWIPLLAFLPSVIFLGRYYQGNMNEDDRPVAQGQAVRIITWNVGRFAMQGEDSGLSSRRECEDSVYSFIKSQDPDIICLQEFRTTDLSRVKSYLKKYFPEYASEYYLFKGRGHAFGNVTLSRLPVSGKGKIKFEESANLAIYTDYKTGGKVFRVYNCHFESYNISFTGLVRAAVNADKEVFTETGSKMKRSITMRPKQVDKVFSHIEQCPVESFVCGDFNDNPMSYSYYRMTRGRKDSFVEAGEGFGATFAGMWPLLRIDYILLPDRFKALEHETPRLKFSDHYPVVTTVEL